MDQQYNLYNLEASFRNWLLAGNKKIQPISINNYLSDLRHFLGWLVFKLKNENIEIDFSDMAKLAVLTSNLTESTLAQYKGYLNDNNIPDRTVNRRLSTLRKFCSFCISQGWLKENPAKSIKNNSFVALSPLEQFQKALEQSKVEKKESDSIISNVRDFLNFKVIS